VEFSCDAIQLYMTGYFVTAVCVQTSSQCWVVNVVKSSLMR
jgi:hypothetical protein